MALFSNKQESNLRSCIQMVEDVIKTLGHDPDESRIETHDDMPAWRVQKGSAFVTVIIHSDGKSDENQLQVSAELVRLDAKVDRLRLYQRLLELNATAVKGAAFGLQNDHVVLVSERSTLDLDLSEVEDLVKKIEVYADHYDDTLVAEFGGQLAGGAVSAPAPAPRPAPSVRPAPTKK
jgi:hypothetical protein